MTVASQMCFHGHCLHSEMLRSKQDDVCTVVSSMLKEFAGYKSPITVQLFPSVRALPWPTCPPQHHVPSDSSGALGQLRPELFKQ